MNGVYCIGGSRQRVGDMTGDLVVLGGVAILGYLLYTKVFKQSGAVTDANKAVTTNTQTVADAAAKSTAGQQELSDQELNSLANTIYSSGADNDGDAVVSSLGQLANQADWNRLYQLFGTKEASTSWFSTCNLLGFNCQAMDLGAWCSAILSFQQKQAVNSMFNEAGIAFQF
jgi:hypothetical protein